MKPTVEELKRVARYMADELGLFHAAGVLMKKVRQLEEAKLDRVP